MRIRPTCRYPECKRFTHRFGLCNKHRKWVERGYITQDLVILKPLKRVASYQGMKCKIPGCSTQPRRNGLCDKHSSRVKEGTLDLDGNAHLKRVISYSKDFKCILCGTGGKIVKGFCRTHYYQFKKGYIDYDGSLTGKIPKRVASYRGIKCKFSSCYKEARSRGFCSKHFDNYQSGFVDINGKILKEMPFHNKGKKCKVCDQEARTKGFCPKHYSRFRKGLPIKDQDFYVNKNKCCEVERCENAARIKGFCDKHYYRLTHNIPLTGPQKKLCQICGNMALAKELCKKHYEKNRREKLKASYNNIRADYANH